MELEREDEFERELRQSLKRHSAPPGLKKRVMARRTMAAPNHHMLWLRLAASLLIVAVLGGVATWRWQRQQEHKRGEEARRQVMIALRITHRALNEVHTRLAAHDRDSGD